jgi:pimeloyl-ACP methyl ester carboxylesterase
MAVRRGRRQFLAAGGALALSACAGLPQSGGGERRSDYAEVNGTRLWYESAGSGDTVVLLHSFTLDRRMWDGQFETWSRSYRVIRYDARGFGKSALPQVGVPYAHHEDLAALLDHLQAPRAHIVGHGMGGRFALDFAVTSPDRCRSLVVIDTVVAGWPWSKAFLDGYAPVLAAGRRKDIAAAKAAWLAHPVFTIAREQPAVALQIETMVRDYSGWHFVNADPARSVTPPTLSQLSRVKGPALVIAGERDPADFRQMSDRVARDTGGKRVSLRGAGYFGPLETPAQVASAVAEFVAAA